ncbi:branched-chain amino acid ABC transporter permease [Parapusillimonas granuli]|uniref:Branched-chain amino acid ABC transporter permease n=1 Tax=Parapusillimonas granuli TaxID=380911 RepID=A0A853G5M8_9BURK|nr:branched-chain amino acid ABC transporter permease [Parapusillimonas granuli]MBB5216737.1 branched-chain amino acid transport system permease protein [Parapusillimonas granuli]MEB2400066.1 branched-chain amino acid ABC transporter permease [Alcaligenaceae bacterium]NYT51619.1 branched-chain amino acid ABC transporter permease [Parapusillimonas granuli]
MDSTIVLILLQDGVLNGAIYALLGLALVLVFVVTRVIFIPQGEFVAFGALTLAFMVNGRMPGTVNLLLIVGALVFLVECIAAMRSHNWTGIGKTFAWTLLLPLVLYLLAPYIVSKDTSLWVNVLFSMALVVPLGPMLYRLVYQPVAEASVLVLLIISVAVHFALTGLALVFFGAEGWRTPPFVEGEVQMGVVSWSAQTFFVLGTCAALIFALWVFFGKTLYGRALRATAVNRRGARLVGISTNMSGSLTFTLAAAIGALSGMLIAPVTTIYYDTGFLIGLKGFVAAIFGGLVSYPIAAGGAIFVGILEAFSSFWASAYKEVIVFTLIIPVLLWRSFGSHHAEDEE